jgi:hypothetical protein
VISEAAALEPLPAVDSQEHIHCEDEIEPGFKPDVPATMRRRITLAHWAADTVRQRIKNEGGSKLSAQLLQELQSTWPRIVETSAMSVEDDPDANRLTLTFVYEIAECWKQESGGRWGFAIADHFTTNELSVLKNTRRSNPIFLGHPRRVLWRARLTMPRRWRGAGWHHVSGERAANLRSDLTIDAHNVVLERALVIRDWCLPADQAGGYARLVSDIGRNTAKLWARVIFGRIRPAALLSVNRLTLRIFVFILVWTLMMTLSAMCHSIPTEP